MKIRIDRYNITFFLLILAFLVENAWFDLGIFSSTINNIMLFIIEIILFSFYSIFSNNRVTGRITFIYITCNIFLFFVPQFIYFIILNHNSFYSFQRALFPFMCILLIGPITYVISDKTHGFYKLFDCIAGLTGIQMIFQFINAMIYSLYQRSFLTMVTYQRNGRLRVLDISCMEGLVVIYCFCCIQDNLRRIRRKGFYMFVMSITLFDLFFIEQTRAMQIAVFVALIVMIIEKNKNNYSIFFIIFVAIIGISVELVNGDIALYVGQFVGDTSTGLATYSIRVEELKYILGYMPDHFIFGSGLLFGKPKPYRKFSASDIGLIGNIYEYGLCTLVVVIIPMIWFAMVLMKTRDCAGKFERRFGYGIFFFLLVTFSTLSIINEVRIFMWPFCFSLFEYLYNQGID